MTILLDMDDVLENLLETWVSVLNDKYDLSVDTEDIVDWDMKKAFPSLTGTQIFEPLHTEDFWKKVEPVDGAVEYLEKLLLDGHKLFLVTSSHPDTMIWKKQHIIDKYFPMFTYDNIIITNCKQMIKGDVLVDDYHENLIDGDYEKILVDAPYNRLFDEKSHGMRRVCTWEEIYKCIQELSDVA